MPMLYVRDQLLMEIPVQMYRNIVLRLLKTVAPNAQLSLPLWLRVCWVTSAAALIVLERQLPILLQRRVPT